MTTARGPTMKNNDVFYKLLKIKNLKKVYLQDVDDSTVNGAPNVE